MYDQQKPDAITPPSIPVLSLSQARCYWSCKNVPVTVTKSVPGNGKIPFKGGIYHEFREFRISNSGDTPLNEVKK